MTATNDGYQVISENCCGSCYFGENDAVRDRIMRRDAFFEAVKKDPAIAENPTSKSDKDKTLYFKEYDTIVTEPMIRMALQ